MRRTLSALLKLSLVLALPSPMAAQPPDSGPAVESAEGRSDWLVLWKGERTDDVEVALEVSPQPLVYGAVVDAVVRISNGSTVDRELEVKALLGEVAHFVGGEVGVAFEEPDQPAQERRLVWPRLSLPAGDQGELPFKVLVTWDATGDFYMEVSALDLRAEEIVGTAHVRETPEYPGGDPGFLASYAFILVPFVLFVLLQVFFLTRRRNPRLSGLIGRGLALVTGALLVWLAATLVKESLEPWMGWTETTCEILDVRYSRDVTTSTSESGERTSHESFNLSLTLRYQGPEGEVVSSGFRKQSGANDTSELAPYRAGSEVQCWYEPADPAWVVVIRELRVSTIVFAVVFVAIGAVLFWLGLRRRKRDDRPGNQPLVTVR